MVVVVMEEEERDGKGVREALVQGFQPLSVLKKELQSNEPKRIPRFFPLNYKAGREGERRGEEWRKRRKEGSRRKRLEKKRGEEE